VFKLVNQVGEENNGGNSDQDGIGDVQWNTQRMNLKSRKNMMKNMNNLMMSFNLLPIKERLLLLRQRKTKNGELTS
jgi:hypothetical protein